MCKTFQKFLNMPMITEKEYGRILGESEFSEMRQKRNPLTSVHF